MLKYLAQGQAHSRYFISVHSSLPSSQFPVSKSPCFAALPRPPMLPWLPQESQSTAPPRHSPRPTFRKASQALTSMPPAVLPREATPPCTHSLLPPEGELWSASSTVEKEMAGKAPTHPEHLVPETRPGSWNACKEPLSSPFHKREETQAQGG